MTYQEKIDKLIAHRRRLLEKPPAPADGWGYAGISPDTKKPMFLSPEIGMMSWTDAKNMASRLEMEGKPGARLPSMAELREVFNQRAELQADPSKSYWSSEASGNYLALFMNSNRKTVGSQTRGALMPVLLVRG